MVIDQNEWYEEMFYDGKSCSDSTDLINSSQYQSFCDLKVGPKDFKGPGENREMTKKDLKGLEKNKGEILGSKMIKNRRGIDIWHG